ncbi:MAG TPA: EamA family transporter [Actinomycetes bacterium]|nr:EamA family transporter [Actinomycetes bacterium]
MASTRQARTEHGEHPEPTARAGVLAAAVDGRGWLFWAALGTVYIVWGSTYLGIRVVVQTAPPLLAAGARFLLAGTLLGAVLVARRGLRVLRVPPAQLATAAVVGVLLLVGGNGLVFYAEQQVPSGLAALIVAAIPLWVIVLRLVARDRPAPATLAGVGLGFAGVAMLLLPGGHAEGAAPAYVALVVLATLLWAIGSFIASRRRMPANPFVATTVEMLAGGLVLTLLAAVTGEPGRLAAGSVSTASLVAFAYLVAFGSLLAFTAYAWLVQTAPISKVATYAYVNPVVAVALGSLLLAEPLTPLMLAGGAVIVAGVALVITADSRVRRRAAAAPQAALAGSRRS